MKGIWVRLVAPILLCSITRAQKSAILHENRIFNAVTSAMRQWGSSLNHNGMSYFIASLPQGLQLYHGRPFNTTPPGLEWFAFEPEHAYQFSYPHRPGHREPRQPPDKGRPGYPPPPYATAEHSEKWLPFPHFVYPSEQQVLAASDGDDLDIGYFHTYRARRQLRVLYIDGTSAGKTTMGTLDTQDLVLLNQTCHYDIDCPRYIEFERASKLCHLAANDWKGRIDGFIRMETGFEVIICDTPRSLELTHLMRPVFNRPGPGEIASSSAIWLRAAYGRYHSIGGDRVSLDFDSVVSAFEKDTSIFLNPSGMPRMFNASPEARRDLLADVSETVLSELPVSKRASEWQAIADMVVNRFAKILLHLHETSWSDTQYIQAQMRSLYYTFMDYDNPDRTAEIARCTRQLVPDLQKNATVVHRSIHAVMQRICSDFRELLDNENLATAKEIIRNLVQYLDWTEWKECVGCAADEICTIPMWPFGSVKDHEHPSCRNVTEALAQRGYWN